MRDGEAFLVCGSRGSGKTAWTMKRTRGAAPLFVWDSVAEWSRAGRVEPARTMDDYRAAAVAFVRRPGRARVGYVGPVSADTFDAWCRITWCCMRATPGVVVVAEELSDVTHPGKAPAAWGEIVRKGRHCGGSIYALTQRPAESDKTIAGNADVIHTGRLAYPRDRKSMAEYLDVPVNEVARLAALEWIERDMRTRELSRGRLVFR